MNTSQQQELDLEPIQKTIINVSLRKVQSGKGYLMKFCVNFKKEHLLALDLENKKQTVLTMKDGVYKLRFQEQEDKLRGSYTVQLKEGGHGHVLLPAEKLKIDTTDPVDLYSIEATYVPGEHAMAFAFDVEEFLKPRAPKLRVIETKEQKVDAGFIPDSAWGEKFQAETDELMEARIRESMRQFYGNI